MFRLTKEGEKYANDKLPELKIIGEDEKDIEKLKEKIENFNVAIQWAKKNGWISIKEGKIRVKKRPKSYDLQKGLENLKEGKDLDEKQRDILEKRNLIKEVREDIEKKAKKFVGKTITNIDSSLLETGLWRKRKLKKYNVKAKGKKI